jgi:nitronate monooxygenase
VRSSPFLELPIVLAPIAGPGTVELTAAACNAGAFGFLASAYRTPEQIRDDVVRLRSLTSKSFGINLFVETSLAPVDPAALARAYERLRPYHNELGVTHSASPPLPAHHYEAQLEAVLEARPAVFSFIFGVPDAAALERFNEAGILTMGTATTVDEAVTLADAGVDIVCAQGAEAGGHRGTFTADAATALIGTLALTPQVVDAVDVPVVAAGGITDGRAIAAVLALGAVGAQCGTAFLRATEASTSPAYRAALARMRPRDAVLTSAFSGRPARGIRNRFTAEMENELARAPYPYQNALTRELRMHGAKKGEADFISLWAGQAFPLARSEPATQIVARLLAEARHAIEAARLRLG